MEVVLQQSNPVLFGDFNVHVSDLEDSEAMDFMSTMSILGLDQHVSFTTHNRGNILDLVFSPHLAQVNVLGVVQGPFFSDHCAVICSLGLMRNRLERKMVTSHRIKSIDATSFGPVLQGMLVAVDVSPQHSADNLAQDFQSLAMTLLEVYAPERVSLQTI